MIKLYNKRRTYSGKLVALFITQIVFGVFPVAIFAVYIFVLRRIDGLEEYETSLGVISIALMVLSLIAYRLASVWYNIFISGYRGERTLIKTAKRLNGDYTVFSNIPIRYKRNRSEIDMLIISDSGVLIIEVKNHSGVISGSENDEKWVLRKYYRKGKTVEIEMDNPVKQIKRQREIFKSILRKNDVDVWVDSILFFSGNPGLRIRLKDNISVVSNENELAGLISSYKSRTPPDREQINKITDIMKEM